MHELKRVKSRMTDDRQSDVILSGTYFKDEDYIISMKMVLLVFFQLNASVR